ncbi:MAG: prepilin-type N-terminal cleavage/methylation domain-containing protein [Candidatus Riflebacteria bacterium]|nr:prepilin-type N-terminal cleavage/methylation domain-containing protein [Candidatus Riflebacteria bacterium]
MNRKAFTLVEIMIGVVLVTVVLTVSYKLISGVLGQMFKSSTKMTNLRAASIILERIKSDVRCAVVPVGSEEEYKITNDTFSFISTNGAVGSDRNRVTYKYSETDGTLRRQCTKQPGGTTITDRALSSAKVSSFSVTIGDNNRFITVMLEVDNERDNQYRSFNSKNNKIQLSAVLYPRFLVETLTPEEMFWHKTSQLDTEPTE